MYLVIDNISYYYFIKLFFKNKNKKNMKNYN